MDFAQFHEMFSTYREKFAKLGCSTVELSAMQSKFNSNSQPQDVCAQGRRTLESLVNQSMDIVCPQVNKQGLAENSGALYTALQNHVLKDNEKKNFFAYINFVRTIGNSAAHNNVEIKTLDALVVVPAVCRCIEYFISIVETSLPIQNLQISPPVFNQNQNQNVNNQPHIQNMRPPNNSFQPQNNQNMRPPNGPFPPQNYQNFQNNQYPNNPFQPQNNQNMRPPNNSFQPQNNQNMRPNFVPQVNQPVIPNVPPKQVIAQNIPAEENISPSLWIGGIHPSITEDTLLLKFIEKAEVNSVKIIYKQEKKYGYAYANCRTVEDAKVIKEKFNGFVFNDVPDFPALEIRFKTQD